ncbi:MAG: MFS transporter [archaeon]|nr:MFS transporter [archaeon]
MELNNFSESSDITPSRIHVISGLFLAVLFCALSGQINDIVSAKYLPAQFGANSGIFTLTFTFFSLGRFFTVITFSKLSDRIGRKYVLIIAFSLYTLGTFLAGIANTIEEFMFFRFIKGTSAYEGVALALINDYYPKGKRGKPIAFFTSAYGFGVLIGSIFGGLFLNWFEYLMSYMILGFFTFLSTIMIIFLVKNHPNQIKRSNLDVTPEDRIQKNQIFKQLIKNKQFIYGTCMGGLCHFCFLGMGGYLYFIILNYYLIPNAFSGLIFLATSAIGIISLLSLGKKENTIGNLQKGLTVLTLAFLSVIILFFIDSVWVLLIGILIGSACLGIVRPSIDNYISSIIPEKIRGEALGFYKSVTLIGGILGTTLTGLLGSIFWVFSPFIVMALLTFINLLISLFLLPIRSKK